MPPRRLKELLQGSVRAQFAATQKVTELTHIKLGSKNLSARMAGGELSISLSDVFAVCLRLLLIQCSMSSFSVLKRLDVLWELTQGRLYVFLSQTAWLLSPPKKKKSKN